jgi:hypothetical protein
MLPVTLHNHEPQRKTEPMSALLELLKQKKQAIDASRKGRTEKIPEGTSRWRVLGSWRGAADPQFWHDFGQHFVKDATGTVKAIYMCTEKTFNRPCAVCDAVAAGVKGATDDATLKIVSDAKSGSRVLVNAMHLDSGEPHKVHILELPPTVFEQLVTIATEWEEGEQSILGVSGRDLTITRTGAGKNTKYVVQVSPKTTEVPAGAFKPNNLDEYVAQESVEQMNRAIGMVRSVAGLLPGPGSSSGLPLAAAGAALLVDEEPAAAPPPRRAAAPAVETFEDVPDTVTPPPRRAAAPAAEAAAPAPAAAGGGDAELDDLLASLG